MMENIIDEIRRERQRQVRRWGNQDDNHTMGMWLTIITTQVGGLAKDLLALTWSPAGLNPDQIEPSVLMRIRRWGIRLAAVVIAMCEQVDQSLAVKDDG